MKEKTPFDLNASKRKLCKVFITERVYLPMMAFLSPLMKHLLESMMDSELESHLQEDKASGNSNRRNGKTKKTVRGLNTGTFELESGRDRSGTFEPKVVPKRQLIITEQLEGHVLSMYAKGMSTRAISDFIREMYAMEISATEISRITESVMPAVNEWRSRPLEAVYPFVFLDCMHYKVRQNGTVESRAIYNILGIGMDGRKDLIGFIVRKTKELNSGYPYSPI
nr:transposase [Sphingobacterium multivorum]